jgi:hypothetical protein
MNWLSYKLKGWRTWIVNGLMSLLPLVMVVVQFLELPEFANVLPAHWLPWYALAMAIVNMWLRAITTSPLGKKL